MPQWTPPSRKPVWRPPSQEVGVGEGFFDGALSFLGDPLGIGGMVQQAPQLFGAAQSYMQTLPSFSQRPVEAAAGAAMGAFAIPQEAIKYGAGVQVGRMQQLGETLGANPAGSSLDVAQRSGPADAVLGAANTLATNAAKNLNVFGATPAPVVDALIPDNLEQAFSWLGDPNRPKTLPPVSGPQAQNLYDPAQAQQRYKAVAPPVVELATDLTAGFMGPSALSGGLKALGAPMRTALGMDAYGAVNYPSKMLGRVLGHENLPQTLSDLAATPAGKWAQRGVNVGPIATLPLGMAATTESTPEEPRFSSSWFLHAGQRAVLGGILAWGATAAGNFALSTATAGAIPGLARIPASASPEMRSLMQGLNDARTVSGTGAYSPAAQPGATLGWWQNNVKRVFSDMLATGKAADTTSTFRRESGRAIDDAVKELPYQQTKLANLAQEVPRFKATHDAAQETLAQAIIRRDAAGVSMKAAKDALANARKLDTADPQGRVAHFQAILDREQAAFDRLGEQVPPLMAAAKHAESEWTAVGKMHQEIDQRVSTLQDAVDTNQRGPVPFEQRFGRMAQLLNGSQEKIQDMGDEMARKFWSGRKTYQRTPLDPASMPPGSTADTALDYGISGPEQDAYDGFRRAFGIWHRSTKGHPTVVSIDPVTKLPDVVSTPERGLAMLNAYIHEGLNDDYTTVSRFVRTVRQETAYSNQFIVQAHANGALTDQARDLLLENPFFLRANVLGRILQDWNETAPAQVEKLFAGTRGIEAERGADEVFTMTTQDVVNRNGHLIQLAGQHAVVDGVIKTARMDPMGLGQSVRRFISDPGAAVKTVGGSVDEIGAQVRVNREIAQTTRQALGSNGNGPLARAVKTAQADVARATDPTAKAAAQAQLDTAQEAFDAAQAKLQALTEQKALLVQRGKQAAASLKDAKSQAPQEAWQRGLETKAKRVADLKAQATAAEAAGKDASSLWDAAAKVQTRLDAATAKGMPMPPATALPAVGWKVVPHFENGTPVLYEMADWMADFLHGGSGVPQIDAFTRTMNSVYGRLWRSSITTLSIPFAGRNMPRDLQQIFLNYNGMRSIPSFLRDYVGAIGDVVGTIGGRTIEDVLLSMEGSGHSGFLNFPAGRKLATHAGKLAQDLDEAISTSKTTQLIKAGYGSTGSFSEQGGRIPSLGPKGVGGVSVTSPFEFIRKVSLMSELFGRTAIFTHALGGGAGEAEAAYLARTIPTDFSKSGSAVRVMNLWMPLLNARLQGELQSWDSFRNDPHGFVGRMTASVVMPYLSTYVWNRTQYGDLMDLIPPDVLKGNGPLIYGKWYNDARQREEPLYFKVPLTDVAQAVTIPLRYLLDEQYHAETDKGSPLPQGSRSVWTPSGMLRQMIAGFIPSSPNADELDPFKLMQSFVTMNPIGAAYSGILTNEDRFSGRPIVDEGGPVLWDRYRWAPPDTSVSGQVGTELMSDIGIGKGTLAPAQVDYAMRMLGGSLMSSPYASVTDEIFKSVHRAFYGSQPLPGQRQLTPEEAQDAGVSFAQFVNQAKSQDARPWEAKNIGFLFGAGGQADTITQKLRQTNPAMGEQWDQTKALRIAKQQWDIDQFTPRQAEIYAHTDWTYQHINEALIDLSRQRQEAFRTLKDSKYPLAITDPKARRDFLAKVPSIPVDADDDTMSAMLPSGTDVDALVQRYMQPPGIDPVVFASMSATQQQSVQQRQLDGIAAELSKSSGTPISPDAVSRAIAARQHGLTIPAMPLPEVYVDDWVDRWISPPGMQADEPPEVLKHRRSAELASIVSDYDVAGEMQRAGTLDPSRPAGEQAEQAVMEIINSQFLRPGPVNNLELSRERAYALGSHVNANPKQFPDFVNQRGQPVGTVDEMAHWTQALDMQAMSGKPKDQWPPQLRLLDRYKSYADSMKVDEMYNSPDYLEYSRWFGSGRTMTQDQWSAYQSGAVAKYTRTGKPNGPPIDPAQALKFDYLVAKYRALPAGPQKTRLQPKIKQIRRMAVPNWQNALDYDELNSTQSSLQNDILAIDRQRDAEQAQYAAQYAQVQALG